MSCIAEGPHAPYGIKALTELRRDSTYFMFRIEPNTKRFTWPNARVKFNVKAYIERYETYSRDKFAALEPFWREFNAHRLLRKAYIEDEAMRKRFLRCNEVRSAPEIVLKHLNAFLAIIMDKERLEGPFAKAPKFFRKVLILAPERTIPLGQIVSEFTDSEMLAAMNGVLTALYGMHSQHMANCSISFDTVLVRLNEGQSLEDRPEDRDTAQLPFATAAESEIRSTEHNTAQETFTTPTIIVTDPNDVQTSMLPSEPLLPTSLGNSTKLRDRIILGDLSKAKFHPVADRRLVHLLTSEHKPKILLTQQIRQLALAWETDFVAFEEMIEKFPWKERPVRLLHRLEKHRLAAHYALSRFEGFEGSLSLIWGRNPGMLDKSVLKTSHGGGVGAFASVGESLNMGNGAGQNDCTEASGKNMDEEGDGDEKDDPTDKLCNSILASLHGPEKWEEWEEGEDENEDEDEKAEFDIMGSDEDEEMDGMEEDPSWLDMQ